jgi:DNA polymerase III subunit beta
MSVTRLKQTNTSSTGETNKNAKSAVAGATQVTATPAEAELEQRNGKTAKQTKRKKLAESDEQLNSIEPPDILSQSDAVNGSTPTKSASNGSASSQGMHVICEQEALDLALAFVKAAVPTKPLQPVLANILVSADEQENKIKLIASDISLTLSAAFEAHVVRGGAIALPAEILVGVVGKCPKGEISLIQSNATVAAKNRKTKSKTETEARETNSSPIVLLEDSQGGAVEIYGMDAGEFPEISVPATNLVSLPAKAVKAGLKGVIFAASTDDSKKILTGVQWLHSAERGQLRCTATDGHQVALIALSTNGIGRKQRSKSNLSDRSCIIPAKTLKELTRNLEKIEVNESLRFAYDVRSKRVLFEFSDKKLQKEIISQCLEDTYPDCQALVERYQYPKQVTIETNALLSKLDRLSALASKKENAVKLLFDSSTQEIYLTIERDYGRGTQTVSAAIPDELGKFEIQFNINYLIDALKALSSSAVNFMMDRPYTPVSLKRAGDLEFPEIAIDATYFILPLYNLEKAKQAKQEYKAKSKSG